MQQAFHRLALAATIVRMACNESDAPERASRVSTAITLQEFSDAVRRGPVRLDIDLGPGTLVARQIEIRSPVELADDGELEGRITAVGDSTLTLETSGLTVAFRPETRFRTEDGDDVMMDAFLGRVRSELAAGRRPLVKAERPPPPAARPQGPRDTAFLAADLRLDDDGERQVEINVDRDNLAPCSALAVPPPGCGVVLRVLGIEIAVVPGTTNLQAEVGTEFEDVVAAVDVDGGTVTLANGATVRLTVQTFVEEDGDLLTLAAVARAVATTREVRAEGRGLPDATGVIEAVLVKWDLDD